MNKVLLLLGLTFLFVTACNKEDQSEIDEALIMDYITENNLNAQVTEEGLYYVIEEEGTGVRPTINNNVVVDYEGFLLDGTKFDSSYDRGEPAEFPLWGVIQGWQIGIPLFKEGGKGKLIIPSRMGYGSNPPFGSGIPRNAVLVFDVHLLDVD